MPSITDPPTSPFGVSSQRPARGVGGMGVSHVQVDNTPLSMVSTPVLFTNEGYIILYLLQLVCEVFLQILS